MTYVYECKNCGYTLEAEQRYTEPPIYVCDKCKGELQRIIQPVGIQFKGEGFYSTDNA